jgi:hypothetical protein
MRIWLGKKDYIGVNEGQCVFTGVLLINGWDGGVKAVFRVRVGIIGVWLVISKAEE